jgi:SAM-dependent methyltransferase
MGFEEPRVDDVDRNTNIEWNRQRWGQPEGWSAHDGYGYQWGRGYQQTVGGLARFCDDELRPWTLGRYDLKICELSPGGGRFTAELIRYAGAMTLVDLNEAAIEVCRQRFSYYPTSMAFYVNDGLTLDVVPDDSYDLVACFDSMVHMHPDVIDSYVASARRLLSAGGRLWLDHSGKGKREKGHRTDMTDQKMAILAQKHGYEVLSQSYRNDHDCVSVLEVD